MVTAVKVQGNALVDGDGSPLQLRGVNCSALEFVAIQSASASPKTNFDNWGGQKPNLSAIKSWGANSIRVPLNEQSYLGLVCTDQNGVQLMADPGGNYRSTVKAIVDGATALGLAVILDLHKNTANFIPSGASTAVPGLSNTSGQSEMADADHSYDFWTAVANDYKSYPNVVFDLFNEPHIDNFVEPTTQPATNAGTTLPAGLNAEAAWAWGTLRDGGVGKLIYANNQTYSQNYASAGMQRMLDTVRATGATNVCMVGGVSWAQDLALWTQFCPKDPLKQMACSWHAYPSQQNPAYPSYPPGTWWGQPKGSFDYAADILAAGYPIIIGETGEDPNNQLLPVLLPWCDAHKVSVTAWTWDVGWGNDSLIADASGTPAGTGIAYKQWLQTHTSGGTPVSTTQNAALSIAYNSVAGFPAGSVVDHINVALTAKNNAANTPPAKNVAPGTANVTFTGLAPDTYQIAVQAMPATGNGFGTPASGSITITQVNTTISLSLPSTVTATQP